MRFIAVLIGGLMLLSAPALAQLTEADIATIRSIVEETVQESEKRLKEYVDLKINELDSRLSGEIKALEGRLNGKIATSNESIKGMEKRLDQIFRLVMVLIAFIAVVVGVPQIIVALQRKNERVQDKKLDALQKQLDALQQEMDTQITILTDQLQERKTLS